MVCGRRADCHQTEFGFTCECFCDGGLRWPCRPDTVHVLAFQHSLERSKLKGNNSPPQSWLHLLRARPYSTILPMVMESDEVRVIVNLIQVNESQPIVCDQMYKSPSSSTRSIRAVGTHETYTSKTRFPVSYQLSPLDWCLALDPLGWCSRSSAFRHSPVREYTRTRCRLCSDGRHHNCGELVM